MFESAVLGIKIMTRHLRNSNWAVMGKFFWNIFRASKKALVAERSFDIDVLF